MDDLERHAARRTVRLLSIDGFLLSVRPRTHADPDVVQVVFPMTGRLDLGTPGRETRVRPPDFVMCDAAEPIADEAPGTTAPLVIHVARARLPLRAHLVDRLVGMPLPGDRGIGAILRQYIVGLVGRLTECRPADATRLAFITLELLTATLAHHADAYDQGSPPAHQRHLRLRIDDFIRRNLGNRDLCPDLIATEHRISLRYLYKLFKDEELSVASTIRRRRLEQCRADLAAPGLRTRSIQAISARWGFSDATQFSNVFRQAYGMSPTEYRNMTTTVQTPRIHDLALATPN